jgi:hypothetical protein
MKKKFWFLFLFMVIYMFKFTIQKEKIEKCLFKYS